MKTWTVDLLSGRIDPVLVKRSYVGRDSRAPLISTVARLGSVYNDEG